MWLYQYTADCAVYPALDHFRRFVAERHARGSAAATPGGADKLHWNFADLLAVTAAAGTSSSSSSSSTALKEGEELRLLRHKTVLKFSSVDR